MFIEPTYCIYDTQHTEDHIAVIIARRGITVTL